MDRVFKYKLNLADRQTLQLPRASSILSVMEQHNNIVLYALVDDENAEHNDVEAVELFIVGTGQPFMYADESEFIGSVSTYDGDLVWHIFRRVHTMDG